jgi:hypothetical protein
MQLAAGSGAIIQQINSSADLPGAIVFAEQVGAHHRAYLLRQRMAGRIGLYEVFRDTSARLFKRFASAAGPGPMLLVVGADDGLNDGPEAWPLAQRMIRWASAIVLHGTGAEIVHYEWAVQGAEVHRRALLIECASATLPAWEALILAATHRPAVMKITPRSGPHPIEAPRGWMQ